MDDLMSVSYDPRFVPQEERARYPRIQWDNKGGRWVIPQDQLAFCELPPEKVFPPSTWKAGRMPKWETPEVLTCAAISVVVMAYRQEWTLKSADGAFSVHDKYVQGARSRFTGLAVFPHAIQQPVLLVASGLATSTLFTGWRWINSATKAVLRGLRPPYFWLLTLQAVGPQTETKLGGVYTPLGIKGIPPSEEVDKASILKRIFVGSELLEQIQTAHSQTIEEFMLREQQVAPHEDEELPEFISASPPAKPAVAYSSSYRELQPEPLPTLESDLLESGIAASSKWKSYDDAVAWAVAVPSFYAYLGARDEEDAKRLARAFLAEQLAKYRAQHGTAVGFGPAFVKAVLSAGATDEIVF